MYGLAGTKDGEPADVLWDDGHIDGSPGMVDVLMELMDAYPNRCYGFMGGPYFQGRDVLKNGAAFYFFVVSHFPDMELSDGELPPPPPPLELGQIP